MILPLQGNILRKSDAHTFSHENVQIIFACCLKKKIIYLLGELRFLSFQNSDSAMFSGTKGVFIKPHIDQGVDNDVFDPFSLLEFKNPVSPSFPISIFFCGPLFLIKVKKKVKYSVKFQNFKLVGAIGA